MAEGVEELPASVTPARRRRFSRRFLVAYALLGFALAVAAVVFATLLTRPEPTAAPPPPQFGQFRPTTGGLEGASQIAEFVGPRYRLPSGKQIVAVAAGPLSVQDTPIPAIAIQDPTEGADADPKFLPGDKTLV